MGLDYLQEKISILHKTIGIESTQQQQLKTKRITLVNIRREWMERKDMLVTIILTRFEFITFFLLYFT
jgi:hypothetical protein